MSKIKNPSLPKEKIKFLLLEGISETAIRQLELAGYPCIERQAKALEEDALKVALADVRLLGIRSRTKVTESVIASTDKLIALGCFSVGTNQVDLEAAKRKGIPVFNAPFSNTRSVAELTIAEIVMLFRRVFPRSGHMRAGGRNRRRAAAKFAARRSGSSGTAILALSWRTWPRQWACG